MKNSTFTSPRFPNDVLSTEIMSLKLLSSRTPQMIQLRADEIKNLINHKTFKVLPNEYMLNDANMLPGRFVLTIKSTVI